MTLAKKLIFLCVLLGFCFTASAQCPPVEELPSSCNESGPLGPNLIANGSFETSVANNGGSFCFPGNPNCGNYFDAGWQIFGDGGAVENPPNMFAPCHPNATGGINGEPVPSSGQQYAKIAGVGTVLISSSVSATAGTTYCLIADMLSPSPSFCPIDNLKDGGFAEMHLEFIDTDGCITFVNADVFTSAYGVGGWFKFTAVGVGPANVASVRALFVAVAPNGGAIYIDNVQLAEKQAGAPGSSSLACNDNINVTVTGACASDLTVDALLEGASDGFYTWGIENSAGVPVDPSNIGDNLNKLLEFTVTDICSGNSCWGNLTFEDKTPPTVECDCPVGGDNPGAADIADRYSEDCSLMCYERPIIQEGYWDNLRNLLIFEDVDDFLDDNVFDNCTQYREEDVNYFDVYQDLGVCTGSLLKRTWTLTYRNFDGSLGYVSCEREYFFAPLDLSTAKIGDGTPVTDTLLLPPAVVEIPNCGVGTSPADIQAFFDNPATEDKDTNDDRVTPQELDIDCVVENNEGTWMAYPHYYMSGRQPTGPHAQAIDNEVCTLIAGFTDQDIEACAPGCVGNSKTLRQWTILDWCTGMFIVHDQVIKVVDANGPQLSAVDVFESVDPWKCSKDVKMPFPEHLADDCDDNLTYSIGKVEGGFTVTGNAEDGYVIRDVPIGSYEVEYIAQDCCNNLSRATVTVTVADNTPPVAVTKQFLVTSVTNIGTPGAGTANGISKIYTADIDNGSYDSCTDVIMEIRRNDNCTATDTVWGDFVTFCCADIDTRVDVEIRVRDFSGNANISWAEVLVEDKSTPNVFCPDPMVVTCDMDIKDFEMTGWPSAVGACGPIEFDIDTADVLDRTEPRNKTAGTPPLYDIDGDGVPDAVPAYDKSCGFGAIRRQFRAGTSTVCEQWFVVESVGTFDPNTIEFPDDIAVDCDGYDIGEPTWEDAVCNLVGHSLESDTFLFEDGACFKILNHWSVIDWCVYDPTVPNSPGRYEHTQVVKVIDTEDPVLTVADSLCFAVTQECTNKSVTFSGSALDSGKCSSEWISWEIIIDAYADWTEDFTYSTDQPSIVDGDPNPFFVPKSANGEEITIGLPDDIVPSSKVWHRAVWRAYDGCNNTASVTRYFQIVDKKAPTPYCLNLSTAVMDNGEVELWAIDFDLGAFDNCTDQDNLLFTFTDVAPPARNDEEYDSNSDLEWYDGTFWYYDSTTGDYETQDDYGDEIHAWYPGLRSSGKIFTAADADASGFAMVDIYVWDECGNKDFCTVNLRIVDNGGGSNMIAGVVETEQGIRVENIMTNLGGAHNISMDYMTDTNGEFAFANAPQYLDYEITGEKNDDYLNGVSTLDLVRIQKHILGQELLDSPYKMIAADVTNDNNITALDLIDIRKLILGITDSYPSNGSWTLVDGSQTLTTANPWIYNESRTVTDLQSDMMDIDFIAVKNGDVTDNAEANFKGGSTVENRSAEAIELGYEDRYVTQGEEVEISLTTERSDIYGYQFTMDTRGLDLVSVTGTGVTQENVGVFADKLTMSYNSNEMLSKGEVVTLRFRAKGEGMISEMMQINSGITRAEAYVGEGLAIVDIAMRGGEGQMAFALYQNEPNPFATETNIGFDLPEAGEATMTLYDVTGKVLKVIEGDYDAGYNLITVSQGDLNVNGMIYYKLQSGAYTATRHMIAID